MVHDLTYFNGITMQQKNNDLGFVGKEASRHNSCPLCGGTDWCFEITETVWMCGRTDPQHIPSRWTRCKDGKDGRPIYRFGKRGKDSWKRIEPIWKELIIDDSQDDWQVDCLEQMRYQMHKHFEEEKQHWEDSTESNSTKHSTAHTVPNDDYTDGFDELMQSIQAVLQLTGARKAYAMQRLAKKQGISETRLLGMYMEHHHDQERVYDGKDFMAKDFGEEEFWVGGLVPKGSAILVTAAPGTGKSSLVYAVGKAVLTGGEFDGRYGTKGKVLIIQGDEGERNTQRKLSKLDYQNLDGWKIDFSSSFASLAEIARQIELEGYSIVICDSYSSLNRFSGFEEKDTGFALCAMEIRSLCDRLGCSFLMIHHLNKAGTTRGTTALEANVDEVWRLTRETERSDSERFFTFNKSRAELQGYYKVDWDSQTGEITLTEEDDEDKDGRPANVQEKILMYLSQNRGKWFEPLELANHPFIDSALRTVKNNLQKLERNGKLKKQRRTLEGSKGGYCYLYGLPLPPSPSGGRVNQVNQVNRAVGSPSSPSAVWEEGNPPSPGTASDRAEVYPSSSHSEVEGEGRVTQGVKTGDKVSIDTSGMDPKYEREYKAEWRESGFKWKGFLIVEAVAVRDWGTHVTIKDELGNLESIAQKFLKKEK